MGEYKVVVIGGSAGSLSVVSDLLASLKPGFSIPIVLCLHRLKHVRSGLVESLNLNSIKSVVEPLDKERMEAGKVYLAPANYHLFVEYDSTFSLSVEEPNNHSRPSIDYTLGSAAVAFREKVLGIILTGANKDGAQGLKEIAGRKGFTIVQDPDSCDMDVMPRSAMRIMQPDMVLTPKEIVQFLNQLEP